MKHMGMELEDYARKVLEESQAARKKIEANKQRAESRLFQRLNGLNGMFDEDDRFAMSWYMEQYVRLQRCEERYNKIRDIVEAE